MLRIVDNDNLPRGKSTSDNGNRRRSNDGKIEFRRLLFENIKKKRNDNLQDYNIVSTLRNLPNKNNSSSNEIRTSMTEKNIKNNESTKRESSMQKDNHNPSYEMTTYTGEEHIKRCSCFDTSFCNSFIYSNCLKRCEGWYSNEIPDHQRFNLMNDMTHYLIDSIKNEGCSFEEQFGPFERIFDTRNFKTEKTFIDPKMILDDSPESNKDSDHDKPPYSYSQLITEALESVEDKKLTLSQIYNFIKEKYPYYKMSDNVWQNSIRHNLSLSKRFMKMKRPKNMPGKGGFWVLNSLTASQESNETSSDQETAGLLKRRNTTFDENIPKKVKIEQNMFVK